MRRQDGVFLRCALSLDETRRRCWYDVTHNIEHEVIKQLYTDLLFGAEQKQKCCLLLHE